MKKLAMILCVSMFVVNGSHAGWLETDKPVNEGVTWQFQAVDGNVVVFEKEGPNGLSYLYDVAKKKPEPIGSLPQKVPKALYKKKIVFHQSGEILLYDIGKKKTRVIGKGNTTPDIYSNVIVYGDERDVVLYDIARKKEKRVSRSRPLLLASSLGLGPNVYIGPSVYKGDVVWIEQREEGGELFLYNAEKDRVKKLIELAPDVISNIQVLMFRDDVILMSNQKDVYIYKVLDGTFKKLTQPGSTVFLSSINKGKVVWDSSGGEAINIYDIAKDEHLQLVSKGSIVYNVSYVDNRILFIDTKEHKLRMFEFKPEKK